MKIKIIGILICILFIFSTITVVGDINSKKCQKDIYDYSQEKVESYTNSIYNTDSPIAEKKVTRSHYKTTGSNPYAIIETTMGTIKIELHKDLVPNTVDNFLKLSNDSFYDGLVFHRVIDDFVIQGGGHYPNGTRKDSPYGPIDLEIHPNARHINGAIGMARTSNPNSATNQFYICDGPQHFLDDEYAVFGVVRVGMQVVRNIAKVETTTKYGMQDWPINDVIINSLTVKAKSFDSEESLSPNVKSSFYQPINHYFKLFESHPNLFSILKRMFQ